jgi:ribonuclease BN (tRNA processing enzyme)
MRVELMASAAGCESQAQYATSYLLNGVLAVDAGSLGFAADLEAQGRVRDVFITHTHADHMGSLPMFLETVALLGMPCPTVWGHPSVLHSLREDVFNDRIWPDLDRLARAGRPMLKLAELQPEQPIECSGLRLTPVSVNHSVDTLGLLVEGPGASVVIASDTNSTERIWELANRLPDLAAVFLEASFPDELEQLATVSKHLTPRGFEQEVAKLSGAPRLVAVHIKPAFRERVVEQLQALELPGLEIGEVGREYIFPS